MTTASRQRQSPDGLSAGQEPAPAAGCSVVLQGKVTTAPDERELPSGTTIATFRLSVPRRATPLGRGSRQTADWVDCVTAGTGVRRSVATWRAGDEVEVHGVLRRRFVPSGGAGSSRLEVEVLRARRNRQASSVKANP